MTMVNSMLLTQINVPNAVHVLIIVQLMPSKMYDFKIGNTIPKFLPFY